jgi:APA family basic amino acid/polyamine antiporter
LSGILRGAGCVFFIGFDAVSTAAQEAKNKKGMPIGILGSLVICTILYVLCLRFNWFRKLS